VDHPRPRLRRLVAALAALAALSAVAVVVTGAGAASAQPQPTPQPGERLPTRGPVGADPKPREDVPLNLVGGLLEGSPIVGGDYADPFILAEQGGLFVYATNTVSANVPVLQLDTGNVTEAEYLGDALPDLPSWTVKGYQWAPSVWARPDGRFVMYYATAAPSQGFMVPRRQCISRAVAPAPGGPFVDDSTAPFICPLDQGGAIDPSVFLDGGTPYLLWKTDGNCCGLPTPINSQRLSADGLSTAGPATPLITATQSWENGVVEGPSMVQDGEVYDLFYSANNWDSADYAVGIAECRSVAGPCTKTLQAPWMRSAQDYTGPGGQEFFEAPGGVWMVHHGFLPGQAGTPGGQRRLYLDELQFHGSDPIPVRNGVEEAEWQVAKLLLGVLVGVGVLAMVIVAVRRRRRRRSEQTPPSERAPSEPVSV
jgi:hypothetical protein